MKPLCLVILLLIGHQLIYGQGNILRPQGARSAALGHNAETFRDINATLANQAGLGFVEQAGGLLSLERRFLLPGLSHASMGVAVPVQKGSAFGFTTQYFGNGDYNEIKIGLGYGRKLFENFSFGAQVDYIGVQIREGGNEGVFTFEAGVLGRVMDNLLLGVHVFSPMRVTFSNDYILPTVFRMSAQLEVSKQVDFFAGIDKDLELVENYKFGIEYRYLTKTAFRLGLTTRPASLSFGFGFKALDNAMIIDISSAWHQLLGYTPGLSVGYVF
jgi:hypothetical protein